MKEYKIFIWVVMLTLALASCSSDMKEVTPPPPPPPPPPIVSPYAANIDTFTFSSNGVDINGKIFLPDSYTTNSNLPAIYLIDYEEQHFEIATDEHDQVIYAVEELVNFDAIVVTLETIPSISTIPNAFYKYYDVFRDMTVYVDSNYTGNTSRTFIGRGSEGGVVLLALLLENPATSVFDNFIATDSPNSFNSVLINMFNNDEFPVNISDKRLHFSYSSTNDQDICAELISVINSKHYPWLTFEGRAYPNNIYDNTYPVSYSDGIRFIFE